MWDIGHFGFTAVSFVASVFLLYCTGRIIYNILLHPLRAIPGPLLWRATSIPWHYYTWTGKALHKLLELHKQYGKEVRMAPSEISLADSQAWKDVFAARPEFGKDDRFGIAAPSGVSSIMNAQKDDHSRYRRLLAHAFSEKGLREQESRIQKYVDLLIDRLHERAGTKDTTDIVDWYTCAVFDIVGDLAWGESFHGLQERRVHEWIDAMMGSLVFAFRFNILLKWGLGVLIPILAPRSLTEKRELNFLFSEQLAEKRAKLGAEPRGDFWDKVLIKSAHDNATGEGMTQPEMVSNASFLVLAGAETSATTLSGTTYLLCKNSAAMSKVVQEIRSKFKAVDDIDMLSVSRLPYLNASLTEAMRVYPPVAQGMARKAPMGGGKVCGNWVPGGTYLNVSQLAMNHLPSNFYRAGDFLPERWLPDAPAEFKNDDKLAFQPFSVGTRDCIGRNLAYAEMKLILAKVLFAFDIELDSQETGDWFDQENYGVWYKKPLLVRLRPVVRG